MKKVLLALFSLFLLQGNAYCEHVKNITANEAMVKLINGNKRFVTMHLKHPDQTVKRRMEGLKGQHPFVVTLSCSDSRVAPEIVFDQGLGDIFEIRNAGNILDDHVIGSIEYAIVHLETPLVVVMGHQYCGAVTATVQGVKESGHITSIEKAILPAVKMAKKQQGDIIYNSIINNVTLVVDDLKHSKPIIKKYVEEGKVKVVGAYYHIDSGKVTFIE